MLSRLLPCSVPGMAKITDLHDHNSSSKGLLEEKIRFPSITGTKLIEAV
jgi:hypothetical protein